MGEQAELHRQQLLTNINAIIESLWRVPGVVAVDVEDAEDMHILWEKKVFVRFAGCDEPVGIELY